jgi:hypothetical protein
MATAALLRAARRLSPGPVAWSTVATLAVLMDYADGFVLTSVHGAVGVTQQPDGPFTTWLRTSTSMLPVYVLAVLGALAFLRSRGGDRLRTPRRIVAAALLVALAGALVGTGELIVGLAHENSLQVAQVLSAAAHDHGADVAATEAALREQSVVHRHAARLGSALLLGVNVGLVAWVVALNGGRLESLRRPPHPMG